MAIRPFDWTGEYHNSNCTFNIFDVQFLEEVEILNAFLNREESDFAYDWWTIMAFAVDEVQDERVTTL